MKNIDAAYFIYRLVDPETSQIRYVGKTRRPLKRRLYQHLKDNLRTDKKEWIDNLKFKGKTPLIEMVEICAVADCNEKEAYWVVKYYKDGEPLLNFQYTGRKTKRPRKTLTKLKVTIQIYVESETADKLAIQADTEKRSLSNLIAIMIEEGLQKRNGDKNNSK